MDVAYELLAVRSGASGLRPLHRTGTAPSTTIESVVAEAHEVLGLAFGPDGEIKRKKAQHIQAGIHASWTDDGSCARDMQRLSKFLTLNV